MSLSVPHGPATESPPPEHIGLFSAMQFRDFRFLWTGLLIGNLGTWTQFTTIGYFVVKLAPSPALGSLYIGFLGAARCVPVLVCSPFAGVLADRYPRRRVLLMTNSAQVLAAFALALLTSFHLITIWGVFLIAAFQAAVQSFDAPARQSWVSFLVPREYVGNAIGLNSIAFNAPSVVGPPIAGLLIVAIGVSASFYVNAVLTIAVIVALVLMHSNGNPVPSKREPFVRALTEGMQFMARHRILRWVSLMLIVTALLVRPYNLLLPAYAVHDLHTGPRGLGWLMASAGAGAIGGAVITALAGRRRGIVWSVSSLIMGIGLAMLGIFNAFVPATVVLFVIGLAALGNIGTSNVMIQTLAPDNVRGRAIAVYSMILMGLIPLGTLVVGSIASVIGLRTTFVVAARSRR